MAFRKEYTDAQYKTFLQTPFNSDFGISLDKALEYFWAHPPLTLISAGQGEGLTRDNLRHEVIPIVQSILGKSSYVMFLNICMNENAAGLGFIAYTRRYGTRAQDCKDDCNYINNLLSGNYPLNTSAPETGGASMSSTAYQIFRSLKKGAIGKYYMTATFAGNYWCWHTSNVANTYFGNPYDQCIDRIKAMGGNAFGGGGNHGAGGQGDNSDLINLPHAIYLHGSQFTFMGVKFRRYKSWLHIEYPDGLNIAGGNVADNSDGKSSNDKVKKELEVFNRDIKGHNYYYAGNRPARNPKEVGYADCSGLVGWILHTAYAGAWNNGYVNTQTLYNYFKRKGCVIWEGTQQNFINSGEYKKMKAGDFVIFGFSGYGAGLSSHTAFCYDNSGMCVSQEGNGTNFKSIKYLVTSWWVPYRKYFCLVRSK